MNYEKPDFTLTDAIRVIQVSGVKDEPNDEEGGIKHLATSCYEDNE